MLLASALPGKGGFVAAAFLVLLVLLLVYFVLMAIRLGRLEREAARLHERLDAQDAGDDRPADG